MSSDPCKKNKYEKVDQPYLWSLVPFSIYLFLDILLVGERAFSIPHSSQFLRWSNVSQRHVKKMPSKLKTRVAKWPGGGKKEGCDLLVHVLVLSKAWAMTIVNLDAQNVFSLSCHCYFSPVKDARWPTNIQQNALFFFSSRCSLFFLFLALFFMLGACLALTCFILGQQGLREEGDADAC